MTKRILEILDNVRYWDTCPDDYKKDIEDFLDKQFNGTDCTVDLSKCKKGDILISRHGAKLEYIVGIQAIEELEQLLNNQEHGERDDVNDSLIGKKVIWKGKEYSIIDKHNISDFVMIDDENNTIIGLHWKDVELVDSELTQDPQLHKHIVVRSYLSFFAEKHKCHIDKIMVGMVSGDLYIWKYDAGAANVFTQLEIISNFESDYRK